MLGAIRRWLANQGDRGEPVREVAEKRKAWTALAERHQLTYLPGRHAAYFQGDRLEGQVDGRAITIRSDANYDLQKLVVVIVVECAAVPPSGHLSRSELVAWYDAEATARGLPATDSNVAAWIAGHRLGVGAFVEPTERALRYRQLYEIDNETLEMLLVELPRFARQLELVWRANGE
jgi:hypothetical protein